MIVIVAGLVFDWRDVVDGAVEAFGGDSADKAKIDAIEEKLLANPEIAKLIDGLGTSMTDADAVD